MTRGRRWVLAVVLVALAAGCGIPVDDEPRTFAGDAQASGGSSNPAGSGEASAYVYLVDTDQLVASVRDVPDRTPQSVMRAILAKLTADEVAAGFVSQIPPGTELRSVRQEADATTVDLSSQFDGVIGSSRQQAIAQITLGLTELEGIKAVQFKVDGKDIQVSSPTRGDVSSVTECDFVGLLPSDERIRSAGYSADVAKRLTSRRRAATNNCPTVTTTR